MKFAWIAKILFGYITLNTIPFNFHMLSTIRERWTYKWDTHADAIQWIAILYRNGGWRFMTSTHKCLWCCRINFPRRWANGKYESTINWGQYCSNKWKYDEFRILKLFQWIPSILSVFSETANLVLCIQSPIGLLFSLQRLYTLRSAYVHSTSTLCMCTCTYSTRWLFLAFSPSALNFLFISCLIFIELMRAMLNHSLLSS